MTSQNKIITAMCGDVELTESRPPDGARVNSAAGSPAALSGATACSGSADRLREAAGEPAGD